MANPAFTKYDHTSIRSALQPAGAGGISSDVGVCAAIYELIDRTQHNDLTAQLHGTLTSINEEQHDPTPSISNYPNPFSESTTIRLPFTGNGLQLTGNEMQSSDILQRESGSTKSHRNLVALKIFDATGREVLDLSEEAIRTSGVVVHGAQLPYHGMYFYRLTTPAFTEIKTMVFLR